MKRCKKCKVNIKDPREKCPLCQNVLTGEDDGQKSTFPQIPTIYTQFNIFFRLLIFISITVVSISLVLNFMLPSETFWSLAVVAGVVGMWVAIATAARKRRNISKTILYQIVIISSILVVLDLLTGWHKWSINYGIPAMSLFGVLTIAVIAMIMYRSIEDYVIYLIMNGLFALIPLIFVLTGFVDVQWPSVVSILLSVISLSGTMLFSGIDTLSELKKRLHI